MDDAEDFEEGLGHKRKQYLVKFIEPLSDEEVLDEKKLFNVEESWHTLLNLPTCMRVMVTEHVQKALKIQVGLNVTQEFPWRQVKFKDLRDNLFEEVENAKELNKMFKTFNPENFVLVGYCPTLTESEENPPEGDPFILFVSGKDTKMAMAIIQNMEAFERWRMQRRLRKKPRRWVSHGTEEEMSIYVERFREEPVDVEVQSVYPIQQPKHVAFQRRFSRDCRDGLVELIPPEGIVFNNVTKKRVPVATQVSPVCLNAEQQTNPTFPSNAWSQYLYELDDADLELDESDKEDEGPKDKKDGEGPPPKPPLEMSEQIQFLLETLDFNQIDSYRNDYAVISSRQVVHYFNPYLQEFICFANISKSDQRFVSCIDWFPEISGLLAVSYAFTTPATVDLATHAPNFVQRAVLEPNPVLLWSFSDNLNYKLEFEAPFEVTTLSFCPFMGDILLGGSNNGLLVLWDLQGRCKKLEEKEFLTPMQSKYRAMIGDFLAWTLDINEDVVVTPTNISPVENSPGGAITGIYWLGKQVYLNSFGKIFHEPDKKKHHKFFITSSFDGTVSFWNLEGEISKKDSAQKKSLPKQLTQNESAFKNRALKPAYSIQYDEPITGVIGDTSTFTIMTPSPRVINASPSNYPLDILAKSPPIMRPSLILATYYGHIVRVEWQGMYSESGAKEQVAPSVKFAMVHDGPIVATSKNPFYPEVFASIGRTVFALWKEDYPDSPIIWRKRPTDLTAVAWSEARPAVLYITRNDGILEAWDILARDDDPVLTEVLGGGIITAVSEHRPSLPSKILGIGDYNSSIRMVKLPLSFDVPLDDELAKLIKYVLRQIGRKQSIKAWEQKYYELNKDIIEAKREAEEENRKELERLEKEASQPRKRASGEEDKGARDGEKKSYGGTYCERMAKKWDALNLNRMMTILMSRKQMDPEKLARETALEKERHEYDNAKKESYNKLLLTVEDEVATIRARILPAEVANLERNEMVADRVKEEMERAEPFDVVAEKAFKDLKNFPELERIDYIELLERGIHRRQLLDQSLGGNTDRLLWYKEKVEDNQLFDCDFGVDLLYNWRRMGPELKEEPEEVEVEEITETVEEEHSDY